MVLKNYYIRAEWPEYQSYQTKQGFNDNAEYCVDSDCYYIDAEWATKCDNGEIEDDEEED